MSLSDFHKYFLYILFLWNVALLWNFIFNLSAHILN